MIMRSSRTFVSSSNLHPAQAALLGVLLGVSWRRIPGARSWCLAHLPCLVREAALEEVFRLRAGAGRDHRRLVQKVGLL